MAAESRRLRAFKRWIRSHGIQWSDAIAIAHHPARGISVHSLARLTLGDLVATIPKAACLTINTSSASPIIHSAGLGGYLGLSLALMYERSLGPDSPWAGYLQLLPEMECVPLVWTLDEIDQLLLGTELHQVVKTDKLLVYEDWKENILPLMESGSLKHDPNHFGPEQYFYAKSLVSSRSFQIDEFHGFGMVPLADLFNHKTEAENVHFTANTDKFEESRDASKEDDIIDDDTSILEMIVVRKVDPGFEVFNTYGSMGNAALLHRYGFTEPDNPFDIVNIDLDAVLEWSKAFFSNRHTRSRISLWRKLDCYGCSTQNWEYFEISSNGEPQFELLMMLFIMFLPHEAYEQLSCASNFETCEKIIHIFQKNSLNGKMKKIIEKTMLKKLLQTSDVCKALIALANIRETLYGSNTIEEDIDALNCLCPIANRKSYHSFRLRVCERRVLQKLRVYASKGQIVR